MAKNGWPVVGLPRLVDGGDGGMAEAGQGLHLPLEQAQAALVGEAAADHLERDAAARVLLLRLVDDAHAAFADAAQDPEAADGARRGWGWACSPASGAAPTSVASNRAAVLDEASGLAMGREQGLRLRLELEVAGAGLAEERGAAIRRLRERRREDLPDAHPAFGRHRRDVSSRRNDACARLTAIADAGDSVLPKGMCARWYTTMRERGATYFVLMLERQLPGKTIPSPFCRESRFAALERYHPLAPFRRRTFDEAVTAARGGRCRTLGCWCRC